MTTLERPERPDPGPGARVAAPAGQSLWGRAWARFRRHRLGMAGALVLALILLSALFAPWLVRHSPYDIDLRARRQPPSLEHPLGTDRTGRDVLARVVYGGRISLAVGVGAVLLSTLIGCLVGSLAGFHGGRTDAVLMRFTDVVMTFPSLMVVLALVAVIGPSLFNMIFAIGILGWPGIARLVRGQFLAVKEMEFVGAARALGASGPTLVLRHIFPNAVSPILVAATFDVGKAIMIEAGLSFLGLGVQQPIPTWGGMLQDAQSVAVLRDLPWMWLPPGAMIALTVLAINFVGDALRDALDPSMRL